MAVALLFFMTFFATTIYSAVVLIQIGGWLNILAGLFLFCCFFICGAVGLLGAGIMFDHQDNNKKGGLK